MKKMAQCCLFALCLGITTLLSGCGDVLDFRNAEISNNKIYSKGENSPFSGSVTNIPFSKIPVGKIGPLMKTIIAETNDKSYSELLIANSIASMVGNGNGGILCDVQVDKGILEGEASCKVVAKEMPLFKMAYKKGTIDGTLVVYSIRKKDGVVAEASFANGELNGLSTIYSLDTGKSVRQVTWRNGVPQHEKPEVDISSSNLEKCVDQWLVAYRKERGEDTVVITAQIDEWESWCKEGKLPK